MRGILEKRMLYLVKWNKFFNFAPDITNYFIALTRHMMKKKDYQKPSTMVVEMRQRAQLLAGSGGLGQPGGYPSGGDPFTNP